MSEHGLPLPQSPIRRAGFKLGEQVEYWSTTYAIYMAAVVLNINMSDTGIASYDLDVKSKAKPEKIRLSAAPKQRICSQGRGGADIVSPRRMAAPAKAMSPRVGAAAGQSLKEDGQALVSALSQLAPVRVVSPISKSKSVVVSSSAPVVSKVVAPGASQAPTSPARRRQSPRLPPGALQAQVVQVTVSSPVRRAGQPFGGGGAHCTPVSTRSQQSVGQCFTAATSPANSMNQGSTTPPCPPTMSVASNQGVMRMVKAAQRGSLVLTQGSKAPGAHCGTSRQLVAKTIAGRLAACQAFAPLDLEMGCDHFDPGNSVVRQQLLAKLGLPSRAAISEMQGFKGGMNEGVWFVSGAGSSEDLVLKLVRCHRIASNILTEAENFEKLAREHPGLLKDASVAFPCKGFHCLDRAGTRRNDLIVMRKVQGERMAEWIAKKCYSNKQPFALQVFERVGGKLAEFHNRYGNAQHGDMQPSNIFYDEERDHICFIDLGGMDVSTMETDVEHFVRSLDLLAEAYGYQFIQECKAKFQQGYRRGAS